MKLPSQLIHALWFPAALGLYSLIFFLPLPPQINFNGIQIIDETIVITSCILIFLAFNKNNWGWKILALVLTLAIFTLPVLRVWNIAESNYYLVLGLLPWSDAGGYYADAITLLRGGLFGPFSSSRPFFASFLAVLLKLSNENILTIIIVLTIINGLVVYLFALEVKQNFGSLTSSGVVLILQIYYRHFAGVLMTEQLGLPLGLIGIANLFHAIRQKNKWFFCLGLFFMTLALLTRAGAFFVIPAILVAGIAIFKDKDRIKPQIIFFFTMSILAAWILNFTVERLVITPGNESMGNFSYTLYGQAVGGKGWTQVTKDHPELNSLSVSEHYKAVYTLALKEIYRNPSGLIAGFIKAWQDFLFPSIFAGFGFIQPGDKFSSPVIQVILTILLLIGLFHAWQHRIEGVYALLLTFSIGILFSIPFIPPIDAPYMRVYAATIAIPSLLACVGLQRIIQKWTLQAHISPWLPETGLIFSGIGTALVFITLAGVIFIRTTANPSHPIAINCPAGLVPLQFKLSNGSFVSLVTNESGYSTSLPTITAKDFRKSLRAFPGVYSKFSISLNEAITPPVLITFAQNQQNSEFLWIIMPPEFALDSGKVIYGCGTKRTDVSKIIEILSGDTIQ